MSEHDNIGSSSSDSSVEGRCRLRFLLRFANALKKLEVEGELECGKLSLEDWDKDTVLGLSFPAFCCSIVSDHAFLPLLKRLLSALGHFN